MSNVSHLKSTNARAALLAALDLVGTNTKAEVLIQVYLPGEDKNDSVIRTTFSEGLAVETIAFAGLIAQNMALDMSTVEE